jgi:GNAT superfamily N-acetyltransferase
MFTARPYADVDDRDAFRRIDAATRSTTYWSESDWQPIHPPRADSPEEARRFVAVHTPSGRVVGYGAVLLSAQSNLDVLVDPAWQRRGVGRLLWERLRGELKAFGPGATVGPWVRSDNMPGRRWLEALGFAHIHKDGPVQLRVADTDVSTLPEKTRTLADQGVVLTTLAAETAADPGGDALARYVALFREVEKDVPGYSAARATTAEQCVRELERPGMDPSLVFLARHRGEYVGLSIVGRRVSEDDRRFAGGPNCWSQHLTGVRRDFRGRGVARALKMHAIACARQHGCDRLLSNSDNPAMRALNASLGFRPGPWLIYHRAVNDSL